MRKQDDPFPVSSVRSCNCLSCSRRRAGLTAFDTETQSRPGARMNRTPEQPDRLSLSRPLLSASLVPRPPKIVSGSISHRICGTFLSLLVAKSACNKGTLSLYHWEGRRLSPHESCDIPSSSHFHRDEKATLPTVPGNFHPCRAGPFYLVEPSGALFLLRDGSSRRVRTPASGPLHCCLHVDPHINIRLPANIPLGVS